MNATLRAQRILVVDDNRDAADSLAMLLARIGAQVHVAHDGVSALEAMPQFDPNAILLDISMPGMDGYQVASEVRRRATADRPLLVALTGWGQEEDRRRSVEAGFDHHLVKPVDFDELQELLTTA